MSIQQLVTAILKRHNLKCAHGYSLRIEASIATTATTDDIEIRAYKIRDYDGALTVAVRPLDGKLLRLAQMRGDGAIVDLVINTARDLHAELFPSMVETPKPMKPRFVFRIRRSDQRFGLRRAA